jgi:hypothetical protein
MRKIERIAISNTDRERLERLVRDRNTPQKVFWRARIVLLASDGLTAEAIAAAVGNELLPLDLQRRLEQRWAARFRKPDLKPVPSGHRFETQDERRATCTEGKSKARLAGLRTEPAV